MQFYWLITTADFEINDVDTDTDDSGIIFHCAGLFICQCMDGEI